MVAVSLKYFWEGSTSEVVSYYSIACHDTRSRHLQESCVHLWFIYHDLSPLFANIRVHRHATAPQESDPQGEATWIKGRIVSVADGDTLTTLAANNGLHKIRLAGIDAPEKAQPFGQRSRQHLSHLAHGKDAALECYKIDRYRRWVCKVMVQPPDCPKCDKTLPHDSTQSEAGREAVLLEPAEAR